MSTIPRQQGGPRMSQIVTHNGTIYLAGKVGQPTDDVTGQTKVCLEIYPTASHNIRAINFFMIVYLSFEFPPTDSYKILL